MRILLLASHAVAEYDDLRMLHDLGHDVFAPGGYADPANPTEDLRPALPEIPGHPDLAALCDEQRRKHGEDGLGWAIDWAKADLHPDLIEWADAIIVHHFPDRWIMGQWRAISRKRVIWRTCGQSNPDMEAYLLPLRKAGLQIVRYSPREATFFGSIRSFAGEDAVIRFGKYPGDFPEWIGDHEAVANLTQNMVGRAAYCGLDFWREATRDLAVAPAGANSEEIGGIGRLPYAETFGYWKHSRVHLYTGTVPASYTLSLIEGMMAGVPTVAMGASRFGVPGLYEADEIVGGMTHETPEQARESLIAYLSDPELARIGSAAMRMRAVELFGVENVGRQWRAFLGG